MEPNTTRRRVDIGENVYQELDREARWLGIASGALATLLIRDGLARMTRTPASPHFALPADRNGGANPPPTLEILLQKGRGDGDT